jgi:hypothetical protein
LGQAQQKAGLSKVQALSQLSILFVLQVRRPLRLGLGQGGAGAVYKRVCIGAVSFIAESNPVFKLVNKLSAKCS